MTSEESGRYLRFMKFTNLCSLDDYRVLLERAAVVSMRRKTPTASLTTSTST
jgi:hypothetical protein